ncbi:PPC domain-containing protein [Acanthopleuribacter pedis]|uniref:PPC domain-containing protein n=1 Tax=Acanthopleuribacter pedis TaxID=442870 RepID=A0A8J7QC08_9BACT|nr:PPC domain-containing protein [Acanthopleuribacter pedis]MBO1323362.1 PPC domain-containing protein [Acanthopleuribacter pedis]
MKKWLTLILSLFLCAAMNPLSAQKMLGTYAGAYYGNGSNVGGQGHVDVNWNCCSYQGDTTGLNLNYLIDAITESNSNTYFYRFSGNSASHWVEFEDFLVEMARRDIDIYAYLPPNTYLQPYGSQTAAWASQLANIAPYHPNLKGMAIDDFDKAAHEHPDQYGPAGLTTIRNNLNGLRLLVTAYYKPPHGMAAVGYNDTLLLDANVLNSYKLSHSNRYIFDGVIFPVIIDTDGKWTAHRDDRLSNFSQQIQNIRANLHASTPIYTMPYATGYGYTANGQPAALNTSLHYLNSLTDLALNLTDGVVMYHLQTHYMEAWGNLGGAPQNYLVAEKRELIKNLYREKATVTLSKDQTVSNLSAYYDQTRDFKIELPANVANLNIDTANGTGNVDLYVRRGAAPTTTWDYSSTGADNREAVSIADPAAGTWYITLKSSAPFDGVTLVADWDTILSSPVQPVTNNSQLGIAGITNSRNNFSLQIPAGATNLRVTTSGGSGNADLHLKYGALATPSNYDFRSGSSNNWDLVELPNPTAGTWYIMVYGMQQYGNTYLTVSWNEPAGGGSSTLSNGQVVTNLSRGTNEKLYFQVNVPAGATNLRFHTYGGSGDADLFIAHGRIPTQGSWDHRGFNGNNYEVVDVPNPNSGTYHIMVNGYNAFQDLNLTVTWD